MTTPGLVDVILPTHRRAHTIGYSIQSVVQQRYAAWRLHVIGDGCDDATEAVVRSFADPRIAFYRFPKAPGFGYVHRNTVLGQTSGEFVAYATDDDLWFPDHLAKAVSALERDGLALAAFRSAHVRPPDMLDPFFFAYDWRAVPGAQSLMRWFVGAVECVHRRTVFAEVGDWNDALSRFGDREFHNRVRASSLPTRYVDELTVLRFYAMHWDRQYSNLAEPPQARYVDRLRDDEWIERLRQSTRPRQRSLAVRRRQWHDFMTFGIRSGPKFARFWLQKWRWRHGSARMAA
jgi:glycosyltransferase involved in cell wall biosynthesis